MSGIVPGCFSEVDGKGQIYISEVAHLARVEVDESGTEAVATTAVHARSKGGPSQFRADHPFVFLIRDNASGVILFIGRVMDPSV
jgi:serpin B